MKWYKLKPDVSNSTDALWSMIGLLFDALDVKVGEERLNKLSPIIRLLFEETDPPKTLTKKGKESMIN